VVGSLIWADTVMVEPSIALRTDRFAALAAIKLVPLNSAHSVIRLWR